VVWPNAKCVETECGTDFANAPGLTNPIQDGFQSIRIEQEDLADPVSGDCRNQAILQFLRSVVNSCCLMPAEIIEESGVRAAPNNHLRLKVECQVIADVTHTKRIITTRTNTSRGSV
jgi:hypothetical protein